MYHNLRIPAFLVLMLLTLAACEALPAATSPTEAFMFATPAQGSPLCEACDQATLAVALTQQKSSADIQSTLTADIANVNAQTTLNSANATLSAAQTQSQFNANIVATQMASTAEIVRVNMQATLNSAASTQSAAQTQSQYNLQVTQALATQSAQAVMTQQFQNSLAAGTQTAISNNIATQTQSVAATSQWYIDQEHQLEIQRQESITFLWMWLLPIFITLFAGLILWGFWRWLKIQQAVNQRLLENPINRLPALTDESTHHHHHHDNEYLPYLESEILSGYQITKPDDQVHEWLNEVKDQLLSSEKEKDKTDDTDN